MSPVGRNDRCPCGSGKKYKKCCLLVADAPAGVWAPAERQSAQIALGRFGWRAEFDGDRAVAEERFWRGALGLLPGDERPEVLEQGEVFFQDWFTTDFRLRSGQTLIELFLEREGRRLRSGELRYLQFRTAEGDELVFATAVFDVRDRTALDRALAGHPDLAPQDDGSYAWFEPGGSEEVRRGLGAFVLRDDRVVLETMSKARAERGRAFLEALAGEAVRYRVTSVEGVERALGRRPPKAAGASDEIPPEVEARLVHTYYGQHYRAWVDTPLPALGGQTPRDAARAKLGRPRVVALLKDMESLSARERLAGRSAYNFGWMWAELELERPG